MNTEQAEHGQSGDPTRVTLNMSPRTTVALTEVRRDGTNQTDAICRSVQLHAALLPYMDNLGRLTLLTPSGERVLVHLVG